MLALGTFLHYTYVEIFVIKVLLIQENKVDIRKFSDKKLLDKTAELRTVERETSAELLEFFHEIFRRRLYADLGLSSMYEYLTSKHGYSEGQASRRVAAARLISNNQLAKEKVRCGELSLVVASDVSRHIEREKLSTEKQNEIIEQVAGKSKIDCAKILAKDSVRKPEEKTKRLDKDTTRISFNATNKLLEKLQKIKEIMGPKKYEELIEKMCDVVITKQELDLKKEGRVRPTKGRTISKQTKREVTKRSGGQCEWRDHKTGTRCQCRVGIELDHIIPYGKGGDNSVSNLRHTCKSHNQRLAIISYGQEKMDRYLKGTFTGECKFDSVVVDGEEQLKMF